MGFAGRRIPAEQRVVCQVRVSRVGRGHAVLLALHPGYVRIGSHADGQAEQKVLLVKVTS